MPCPCVHVCDPRGPVTQETSRLGRSHQPDWSHKPKALTHLPTRFSQSPGGVTSFFGQINTLNESRSLTFFYIQAPGGVYWGGGGRIMKIQPKPWGAAASLNKDRWSRVVWQWVTDIHRHACLFLSTPVFTSAWNAEECSSVLMANNPGYESTRPHYTYTYTRGRGRVRACVHAGEQI